MFPILKQYALSQQTRIYYSNLMWADKYRPASFEELCGNHSSVEALKKWLHDWYVNKKDLYIYIYDLCMIYYFFFFFCIITIIISKII